MLASVMVFAYCFQFPMWLSWSPVRPQAFGFALLQPYLVYSWQAYVPLGDGWWPMQGVHWVITSSTAFSGESFTLLTCCPPAIQSMWWGIQLWGCSSHLILLPSLHVREGSSLPGCISPDDMVNSNSGHIKPGDFVVVIQYEVGEFTCA